jgi:hypothetical protein
MMWAIMFSVWVSVFCEMAYGESNQQREMSRFQALSAAQTLTEFESVRQRYDLADAAMVACRRELTMGKIPVNCYVIVRIDGSDIGLRSNLQISLAELNSRCQRFAAQADIIPRSEHLKLLPAPCANKIKERSRLLAYKLGKAFE